MNLLKSVYRSVVSATWREAIDYWRATPDTRRAIDAGRDQSRLHRDARIELFRSIGFFANVNRPITGAYMEFGCFGAYSMRMAWSAFGHFGWSFYGFDSFEGLPEIAEIDKQEIWAKGKLAMGEAEFRRLATFTGLPESRLRTVKGFYGDSLTPALAGTIPDKAAVIYIDCDLYVSTVDVLKWIPQFLQPGTFVVFDDWDAFLGDPDKGERRAWREFLETNPHLQFDEFYYRAMIKAFLFQGAR
jgi:O-methyltransferase